MDETTIATEDTTGQQQLAELQAKVEGLLVSPIPIEAGVEETPVDLEKTPEFEAWKQRKIQETLSYLRDNWKMEITVEKLIMKEMYCFVDRDNPRAHASVQSGCNYVNTAGEILINPATGKRMSYAIWREIDTPTPKPIDLPTT